MRLDSQKYTSRRNQAESTQSSVPNQKKEFLTKKSYSQFIETPNASACSLLSNDQFNNPFIQETCNTRRVLSELVVKVQSPDGRHVIFRKINHFKISDFLKKKLKKLKRVKIGSTDYYNLKMKGSEGIRSDFLSKFCSIDEKVQENQIEGKLRFFGNETLGFSGNEQNNCIKEFDLVYGKDSGFRCKSEIPGFSLPSSLDSNKLNQFSTFKDQDKEKDKMEKSVFCQALNTLNCKAKVLHMRSRFKLIRILIKK